MKALIESLLCRNSMLATLLRFLIVVIAGFAVVIRYDPALYGVRVVDLVWRNALPVVLVGFLLYALTARVLISTWLMVVFTYLLYVVNTIKMRNMNMPVMPGDLVLGHQVFHNMDFFEHYTVHGMSAVVAITVFVVVSCALWRIERHGSRPSRVTRGVWLVLSCAALATIFGGVSPWPSIYSSRAIGGFQLWDPAKSVDRSGLLAGLVYMSQQSEVSVPPGDATTVRRFAKKHHVSLLERVDRKMPAVLPDVVVVQSEAFFDPGIMKQIEFGQFDPNFYRLSRTGISGALLAPTYGGGTIRTEFETLTGYPMRAFPSIVYPYYGLAQRWMPSVPTRLARVGYTTTLFHPFKGEFWNRVGVMPKLGFQKMYFEQAFGKAKRAGLYISDHALFQFVFAHLKKNATHPQYVMVITMENHGPWDRKPRSLPNILASYSLPKGLSAKGKREMRYYLSHLVNGDAALGRFAKKLMARKHWTILVFYGDHLPALDAAFKDIGFDDGGTHATQRTRYMLISNRPLKPRQLDLDSYELPGLLFDTIGLPMDGYLAFDGAVRQAWVASGFKNSSAYSQVLYNAARLEVACQSKITLRASCGSKPHRSAPHAVLVGHHKLTRPIRMIPAPSLDAGCESGSCANGELQVEPSAIAQCTGQSTVRPVTVSWNAPEAGGAVRVWVHNPGGHHRPTLWVEKPFHGSARTGPWVKPGTVFILTGAKNGKKLSMRKVGAAPCGRG